MGYVAQLALLPPEISATERGVVSALLHVATNTFDDGSICNLLCSGGPAIVSLKVSSLAVLARTAYKTLPEWRKICAVLADLTDDMPGQLLKLKVANPACWNSPPFAFILRIAAECFQPAPIVDECLKPSRFINKDRQRLRHAARDATRLLN